MEHENKPSAVDNPYDVVDAIDELTKTVKIVAGSLAKIAVVQQAAILYPDGLRHSLIEKCRRLMAAQTTAITKHEDFLRENVGMDKAGRDKNYKKDVEPFAQELNEFSLQHPVIIQLLVAEIVGNI